MTTVDTTATEYRNLPLALLTESTTNPRRVFDEERLEGVGREHPQRRAFSRPCWFVPRTSAASRSSSAHGVTAPRRWPRPRPFPSASRT